MKTINRILALAILAFVLFAPAARADDSYSAWVATPTSGAQTSTSNMLFPDSTPTTVTPATSTVTNLCASLGSNEYQYLAYQVSSGTVYQSTDTATPSNGLVLPASTYGIQIVPLPAFAKDRGYFPVIGGSAECKVKIWGIKLRASSLGGQ